MRLGCSDETDEEKNKGEEMMVVESAERRIKEVVKNGRKS
jgi:hypothetical protein